MAKEISAPNKVTDDTINIFLSGSIENGKAEPWQEKFINKFKDFDEITFLNPRRQDWDDSWGPGDPRLIEQINWELEGICHYSDCVVFFFDPKTKSPITLLELGMVLNRFKENKPLVCCPDGYWRKDNVVETCKFFGVNVVNSFDDLVYALFEEMETWKSEDD